MQRSFTSISNNDFTAVAVYLNTSSIHINKGDQNGETQISLALQIFPLYISKTTVVQDRPNAPGSSGFLRSIFYHVLNAVVIHNGIC